MMKFTLVRMTQISSQHLSFTSLFENRLSSKVHTKKRGASLYNHRQKKKLDNSDRLLTNDFFLFISAHQYMKKKKKERENLERDVEEYFRFKVHLYTCTNEEDLFPWTLSFQSLFRFHLAYLHFLHHVFNCHRKMSSLFSFLRRYGRNCCCRV